VLVVPQNAQGRDIQQQPGGGGDVEAHPGDRDCAKDVAVREREHAAAAALGQGDELLSPRVDLLGRLAAGASVLVQLPSGLRAVDRLCGDAFVVAVVHLAQKWCDPMLWKPRDLGGARRPLERTRINNIKMDAREPGAELRRLFFAVLRQRQVGAAGVAAVERPLRLAMSGEVDLERQAGLPIISGRPERKERLALSITAPALTRWPGRMQTSPTAA
jgi:hypothetical protein